MTHGQGRNKSTSNRPPNDNRSVNKEFKSAVVNMFKDLKSKHKCNEDDKDIRRTKGSYKAEKDNI